MKHFSFNANADILTYSYDRAKLEIMESLGTDESYIRMIEDVFHLGMVFDMEFRYHSKQFYTGLYGQYIILTANDTTDDLFENYFGVNLGSFTGKYM